MKSQLILFSILLAHASASGDPAPQASEVRKTADFHAIDIVGTIAVEARIDRATTVEVRGEADRIKQVTTDVKNGVLVINTKGKLDNSHLRVFVTAPDLSALTISGTGELTVHGLANGKLDLEIPGTGAMTLDGKTSALHVAIGGSGSLKAKSLLAESATIDVKGTGQATLYASKSIDANVSGTGAIKVYGKPASVKKSITGTAAFDVR
jgi:hypothetical protein